jgi:hypothetical protein
VESGLLDSLFRPHLEPRLKKSQFASLLELFHKLRDRAESVRVQQLLDVDLFAIELKQCSQDLRSSFGIDLEQIDLDELLLSRIEKISGKFLSETVHITEINQRSRIGELGLHEELLNLDGLIVRCLTDHSLNLFEVLQSSTSLDVLEVDLWVLSLGQNIGQVEQGALIGSKALKNLNSLFGLDLLRVLNSDLGDDGDVLSV